MKKVRKVRKGKVFYAFLKNSILWNEREMRCCWKNKNKNLQCSNIMLHKICIIKTGSLILIWIHKIQTSFSYPDSSFPHRFFRFGILSNNLFSCQEKWIQSRKKSLLIKTFQYYMHDVMQLLTLMFETLNINCLDYFPSNYPKVPPTAAAAAKLSDKYCV